MNKLCDRCYRIVRLGSKCECRKNSTALKPPPRKVEVSENEKLMKSYKWQKLRLKIIKRDFGLCQRCLIKKKIFNAEQLEVHHIKSRKQYPELIFEESNLITVCKVCNLELGVSNELDFETRRI